MPFTPYNTNTGERRESTSPGRRYSTRQLEFMPNNRGSRSRSNPDRQPFPTIDDAREKVQEAATILDKLSYYKHPLAVRKGSARKEVVNVPESGQMKGSGRTYFFDFKETKEGKTYLVITESRKANGDKFQRSSIMVFPEDADEFAEQVSEATAAIA